MLVLTRKKDEKIIIDDDIEITVVEMEGGQVKLGIEAPDDVDIFREEIYEKVKSENIEATNQKIEVEKLKKFILTSSEENEEKS